MKSYAKAIVAILVTIGAAIVAFAADGNIDNVEWINTAIAGVGAVSVYYGPNTRYAPYTKGVLAVLSAILVLLTSLISNGIAGTELIQLLIVGAGAVGVYAVPNKGYVHGDPEINERDPLVRGDGPVGGPIATV